MLVLPICCGSIFAESATATAMAYAYFEGEELTFDVDLYNFVSGTDYDTGYTTKVSSIVFDTSTVEPGVAADQWAKGQTFAKVSSNLTSQPTGTSVYMYTTNSTATGTYKAMYPRYTYWSWGGGGNGVNLYRGLIRENQASQTKYEAGDYAPVTVLCVSTATANATYRTSYPSQTQFNSQSVATGKRELIDYEDSWVKEAGGLEGHIYNTTDSKNDICIGEGGPGGGIWTGTNTYVNSDVIIFFGAQFNNVYSGDKYGTETIHFSVVFDADGE